MCSAIDLRMTLSFTRSSRAPSTGAGLAVAGAEGLEAAPLGAAVVVWPDATAASTSSRVTRPPMPDPRTEAASMPCSAASLRTAGESRARSPLPSSPLTDPASGPGARPPAGAGGTSEGATVGGAAAAGVPAPATSICPITEPTRTVSPSATEILTSLPSKGEGISAFTLSVTTSTSGSSRLTKSPSCFSQWSTVPSVTDSPSCGILIWARPIDRV